MDVLNLNPYVYTYTKNDSKRKPLGYFIRQQLYPLNNEFKGIYIALLLLSTILNFMWRVRGKNGSKLRINILKVSLYKLNYNIRSGNNFQILTNNIVK